MSVSDMALKAYTEAMQTGANLQGSNPGSGTQKTQDTFTETLKESLGNVNELQGEKSEMVKAFASGESENVHELMISLEKAGVAMQMTSAVRNKVLETYQELMQMPF